MDSLTASEAYEVIVSSDTAALGIDSCGATSQTQLVTGTASHAFKVIVYACAVDGGTVTAEVRRSGSSSAEASASQGLTVLPIPDYVPADERPAPAASGAAARATSGAVARVGTPGIVQNVQVAERGPTSFKITWSPPAGNGGEPLTGYGLLIWHKDVSQPPYNQAASIGVTDNHTFTGLQPSNTYRFRIHACNGTDSCGWWTAILEATTTVDTTPPPSGRVQLSTLTADSSSLTVNWSVPDTGGMTITGYHVLWRQSGSPWVENNARRLGATARSHTATGLNANTTYVVKVRACRGANGDAPCWDWSADGQATTSEPELIIGLTPGPITTVSPECPYTSDMATGWGPPMNLDVTPQEQRQITLCWTPVTSAKNYTVLATHNPTARRPSFSEVTGALTDTRMMISLDDIYKSPSNTGLAQHKAFGLKVKVEQEVTGTILESDMIIIIDTPITRATTKDQASDSLRVEWDSVEDVLGTSYNNGEYDIRYRKSSGDYSVSPGNTGYFSSPDDPELDASSPHTIGSLTSNSVYGLQLVYRDAGPSGNTTVFAARHAYAFVSDQAIPNGSAVAGVPATNRVQGTTFRYKICTSTFLNDGRIGSWEPLITEAFRQWQAAVTTDLITIEESIYPCTDYHTVAGKIFDRYQELLSDPSFGTLGRVGKIILIEHYIQTTDEQNVAPWDLPGIAEEVADLQRSDSVDNEIKMLDDTDGVEGYLERQEVFTELASVIGHDTGCWYFDRGLEPGTQRQIWELDDKALMCYLPNYARSLSSSSSGKRHVSGDIFIRRSKFTSDLLLVPASNAMFNMCRNSIDTQNNNAYESFLHEVGHALGIGGKGALPNGHSFEDVASVVNYKFDEPDCAPHPADIVALYALYQNR